MKTAWRVVGFLATTIVLYYIAQRNYILFHSIVEIYSVVVAALIFTLSWFTRNHLFYDFPINLGLGYLFVAMVDIIHTIAYKGMNIFATNGANLATQLWITARYLEALTLLMAPLFFKRKGWSAVLLGYTLAMAAALLSIFYFDNFPVCYIEGVGLTAFKIYSEYLIILMLIGAAYHFCRRRIQLDHSVYRYLMASLVVTIVSEFFFTRYFSVYDLANFTGHILKLLSFILIFFGLVKKSLEEPIAYLTRDLYQANFRLLREACTDGLTGILNHNAVMKGLATEFTSCQASGQPLPVILADLDHFKQVNDCYGHLTGDRVLAQCATLLRQQIRTGDLLGRYGGEEFIIGLPKTRLEEALVIAERIRSQLARTTFSGLNNETFTVTISCGVAVAQTGENLERLIDRADQALYAAKKAGRDRVVVDNSLVAKEAL